jgi:hypothetical protein
MGLRVSIRSSHAVVVHVTDSGKGRRGSVCSKLAGRQVERIWDVDGRPNPLDRTDKKRGMGVMKTVVIRVSTACSLQLSMHNRIDMNPALWLRDSAVIWA